MVIGICQTDIVFGDTQYNLILAEDYVAQCQKQGARLVLFPEMSMTGYTLEPETVFPDGNDRTLEIIRTYAARYQVAIGVGYVQKEARGYTNRYAIVEKDGTILCDYAKIHPFSVVGEDRCYTAGDSLAFCTIDGVTVCPFICYDLRFPELFQAASERADLFIVAANWNGLRNRHWQLLLQARAIENQSYVIGVNRVGEDALCFYAGNSMAVDPEGQILNEADGQAGILLVTVGINRVKEVRAAFPVKKDRRKELYANPIRLRDNE